MIPDLFSPLPPSEIWPSYHLITPQLCHIFLHPAGTWLSYPVANFCVRKDNVLFLLLKLNLLIILSTPSFVTFVFILLEHDLLIQYQTFVFGKIMSSSSFWNMTFLSSYHAHLCLVLSHSSWIIWSLEHDQTQREAFNQHHLFFLC